MNNVRLQEVKLCTRVWANSCGCSEGARHRVQTSTTNLVGLPRQQVNIVACSAQCGHLVQHYGVLTAGLGRAVEAMNDGDSHGQRRPRASRSTSMRKRVL